MIAYFLLVHRYPEQFKRLFRAIYEPGNQYLVHVDKRSGKALADDITAFLAPYQGAAILPSKKAVWGGYSLVDAELRGMKALLAMDKRWTHFINLSGQDFPLKSQRYIREFLQARPGRQFILARDQRGERPETMNRLAHRFLERFGRIFRTRLPRAFMSGVTPFIGTQWKIVTRDFCEFAVHDKRATKFKRFYAQTFIADEGFFQTLMMNTPGHGVHVNDDLRTIDWVPDGDIKLRPRTFVTSDITTLIASPDLFARKFDATEDAMVIGLLEAHIRDDKPIAANEAEIAKPVLRQVA